LIWSIALPFPANEMDMPAGVPSGWFPLRRKIVKVLPQEYRMITDLSQDWRWK